MSRPSTELDRALWTDDAQTLTSIRVRGYAERFRFDPPAELVAATEYRLLLDPATMTARVEPDEQG